VREAAEEVVSVLKWVTRGKIREMGCHKFSAEDL
jgi:hypothetical protein